MEKQEIIDKIVQKREFSELPKADILKAFDKFDKDRYSDEEKVKLTRDFLRKAFSGFSGKKLFVYKDKSAEEILKKHLSTRERFEHYEEIYGRLLKNLPKDISILDLGSGVNGFSYKFFEELGKKVDYVGLEAVGQLSRLVETYFKKEKIKNAEAIHESIFEIDKVKELLKDCKKPRVVFMFKVVDSLEKFERDFTKRFLEEIVPLADRIVVSFATESFMRRKRFYVNRKWLTDFIKEKWQFTDDFEIGGERYLVFEK